MKTLILFFSFAFIFTINSNQSFSQNEKLDLNNSVISSEINSTELTISKNNESIKLFSAKKEKSPVLGAVLSGLVPGAGEFYAESYIKAAAFFAVEVGLWTFKFMNDKKGDDKTTEYQKIADQNWDIYKYAGWLQRENFSGASNLDLTADKETLRRQVNVVEQQNFSHSLPNFGAQQYYEVIGKYQSFIAGWSWSDLNVVTRNNYFNYRPEQVDNYMIVRQDANDYYDKASLSITGVILNHLLSAADAAWSVSMFNNEIRMKSSIETKNLYSIKNGKRMLIPFGNLSVTF
ncbi:MAG TPA: hypothetical protein DEP28_06290 [Bacteroidetes bacterium]|nr:hypothetical protein [Bacteroidota bacterium]